MRTELMYVIDTQLCKLHEDYYQYLISHYTEGIKSAYRR